MKGQGHAKFLALGPQVSCSGKQTSFKMNNSSRRLEFGLDDSWGPFNAGIPWFNEYKLFSRKKWMCQVKFAPIYTESPDLTEVPVSLPTCLKKKWKKKKNRSCSNRGWTASWKNLSATRQTEKGIQKASVYGPLPEALVSSSSKSEVGGQVYEVFSLRRSLESFLWYQGSQQAHFRGRKGQGYHYLDSKSKILRTVSS